jgi:tRNA A37 methylthiotransferase MiaB
MDNPVPRADMDRRMAELLEYQDSLSLRLNEAYEGSIERVLVDSSEVKDGKTIYSGRTLTNKLVYFTAESECVGEFINVKITKACPYHLLGEAES